MFHPVILVAVGGAIGALSRYGLAALVVRQVNPVNFPWGTFVVNLLGCALAGLFLICAEQFKSVDEQARLFLVTGILGGFTTFSAFGIETLGLIRRGEWLIAFSYTTLSVVLGVLLMWLVYAAVKLILNG